MHGGRSRESFELMKDLFPTRPPPFAPRRRTYAGRARRRACERRAAAAGWQVPAEPTMSRLNSQVQALSAGSAAPPSVHDAAASGTAAEQGRPPGRWLDVPRRRILVSNRRRCRQEANSWLAHDGGRSRGPRAGGVRLGHARATQRARRDGGVQDQCGGAAAGLPRHVDAGRARGDAPAAHCQGGDR